MKMNKLNPLAMLISNIYFSRKIRNVMVIGNYGSGNVGDEAMLKVISKNLKDIGTEKIFVPSRNIQKLNEIHPNLIYPVSFKNFFKEFFSTDLVIIGSGTLFAKNSSILIYPIIFLPILSRIFGKKVIYYAIGFSSTSNYLVKIFGKFSMFFTDGISVRDKVSLINLRKLGIRKEIILVRDPAFELKPNYKTISKIFDDEEFKISDFLIGISLKHTNNFNDKILIEEIVKVIDWLINQYEAKIIFFNFDPAFTHKFPDVSIAQRIKLKLKNKSNFIILNYYPPEVVLALIKKMKFFIGMRYHSIVFSHMMNTPFLGIVYDEKNETFLNQIDNPYVRLYELDFKKIREKLKFSFLEHKISKLEIS